MCRSNKLGMARGCTKPIGAEGSITKCDGRPSIRAVRPGLVSKIQARHMKRVTFCRMAQGVAAENLALLSSDPQASAVLGGAAGPSELLIRASLYQRMYASKAATKYSMIVESPSREKNISVFRRPKKPSHAAMSGEPPYATSSAPASRQRSESTSLAINRGRRDRNAPGAARRWQPTCRCQHPTSCRPVRRVSLGARSFRSSELSAKSSKLTENRHLTFAEWTVGSHPELNRDHKEIKGLPNP